MYNNESYDDYIRSILGYPNQRNNMQNTNTCGICTNNMFENDFNTDGYNMNMTYNSRK